jgi:uncharacterized protein (DUF1778 family)
MHQKGERILTKRKQVRSVYIMNQHLRDLMIAAAYQTGESRSEFLRTAVRERAMRILGGQPVDQRVNN